VIYLEDLRSLEAHGTGRTLNTRLSQTVRGQIADWIRHLAAETGIAVVTVPARGTSKHCPRCLAQLRHAKAPDKPHTPGWKWAICPNPDCGWQGDRDNGAWQRIAARGLAHQDATAGRAGAMAIRVITNSAEAAALITPEPPGSDRFKAGPTPATSSTPRAHATRGTLPGPAPQPSRTASGGTRHPGTATAPRSPPEPGRDHDQPTPHPAAPATRGSTRRRIPPPRPRHPAPMGNDPATTRFTTDH
jgi:hypothetical protein